MARGREISAARKERTGVEVPDGPLTGKSPSRKRGFAIDRAISHHP